MPQTLFASWKAVNVELVIKVLNGCGVNNRYWVFAGGLTDVRTRITVTDTRNGTVKTYLNPQGTAFLPIQDRALSRPVRRRPEHAPRLGGPLAGPFQARGAPDG